MGHRIGARGPRGLNIELLQDLNRERAVTVVKQRHGPSTFFSFGGMATDGIEQNVGVEENESRHAPRS